jgi:FkbM family methyltransferase
MGSGGSTQSHLTLPASVLRHGDGARAALRRARVRAIAARICADGASARRLSHLVATRNEQPPAAPVPIRLRALAGAPVHIRPGTADADVLIGAFHGRYHLRGVDNLAHPKLIWDLGANIGLTVRQMSVQFPAARIVAVELDEDNLALARRNVADVADRVELLHGAVWPDAGTLSYGVADGEGQDAFRVADGGTASAPAITLDELLDRFGPPDFVKMDIEGAEEEVLARHTGWSAAVPRIAVEYHHPFTDAACERALRDLGFDDVQAHRHGLLRRGSDSLYAARSAA